MINLEKKKKLSEHSWKYEVSDELDFRPVLHVLTNGWTSKRYALNFNNMKFSIEPKHSIRVLQVCIAFDLQI